MAQTEQWPRGPSPAQMLVVVGLLLNDQLRGSLLSTFFAQGKFVRIHFGTNGKIAGADIETCE